MLHGGLYAELVQNRGFEYSLSDKEGNDKTWNNRYAWSSTHMDAFHIDSLSPIHPNNPHYAVLEIEHNGVALINDGFNGIPVKAGEKYDLSLFARSPEKKRGPVKVRLTGKNGEIYGETTTGRIGNKWKKMKAVITVSATAPDARIELLPQQTGRVELDMISLFPQNTFKGRKNGMRADLAQTLADLKPRFMRFPEAVWRTATASAISIAGKTQSVPLKHASHNATSGATTSRSDWDILSISSSVKTLSRTNSGGCSRRSLSELGSPWLCNWGTTGRDPHGEMDVYIQSILNLIEVCQRRCKIGMG